MGSVLEKLDVDIKLPYDEESLNSGRVAEYLLELVRTLQELLREISVLTNYSLDLTDGDAVYYAGKNANGDYPIGTWRRKQVGDDLEDQVQLTLGNWTTAQRRERPV